MLAYVLLKAVETGELNLY